MTTLNSYLSAFAVDFPDAYDVPWIIVQTIPHILKEKIKSLSTDYLIRDGIAIHKSATIEDHVVLKAPVIISANCFIGAHAYLRGGVYLGEKVSVGPGCEIKSSFIMPHSALAHFNFVGDSLIGSFVNLEAGSIIANHYNDRQDKRIFVLAENKKMDTGVTKFGALVGDHCKIGANAVLSPGTILLPNSIVKRLELIEQIPEEKI